MDGFVEVGTMEALEARNRKLLNVNINGRVVTIFKYKEQLYCMDTNCYHAGGALSLGPIEEVNGTPCISCPIHHYKLSLIDGRQASFTYDVVNDEVGPCYLVLNEKERPKQRVHDVMQRDGKLFVRINDANTMLSDRLAFKPDLLRHNGDRVHITIGEAPPPPAQVPSQQMSVNKPNAPNRARAPTLPMNGAPGGSAASGAAMDDDIMGA